MTNFQNVLDTFIHHDSHDAFAQSLGYSDAAQMVYYENMTAQGQSQQDTLLHELAKVDSREVYTDSEECPRDGDFSEWATAVFTDDLSGVY
jgi:hypothetical protein